MQVSEKSSEKSIELKNDFAKPEINGEALKVDLEPASSGKLN